MLGHLYGRGHGVKADNETAPSGFLIGSGERQYLSACTLGYVQPVWLVGRSKRYQKRAIIFSVQQTGGCGRNAYWHFAYKILGVRRDYAKALRLFNQSASPGHTLAQNKLAQMKLLGLGAPPSCEDAAINFQKCYGAWSMIGHDEDLHTGVFSKGITGPLCGCIACWLGKGIILQRAMLLSYWNKTP